MKAPRHSLILLLPVFAIAFAAPASATVVASDDFDDANGTLLDGKPADGGGTWRVTQNGGDLDIQAGALDTTGAGRTGFLDFSGDAALGPGEVLSLIVTTQNPSGDNYFSGGFAGFSFFTGSDDAEAIFVGDTGAGESWGVDGPGFAAVLSDNADPDATAVFTYAYDTGAYSLAVDGMEELSGDIPADFAVDRFRFINGGGGDFIMDEFTVDISNAIPEPNSVAVLAVAAVGLAVAVRRRTAGVRC